MCCLYGGALFGLLILVLSIVLYTLYDVVEFGELHLPNAPGKVTISREKDTKIFHIKGDDW